MKYLENVKAQLRKGVLEYSILLIIEKGEVYASDILNKLRETELIVVEGTLYPLLSRLKRNELVEYAWKESKAGPPRKYYKLTKRGKELLKELKKSWNSLKKSVNSLSKSK